MTNYRFTDEYMAELQKNPPIVAVPDDLMALAAAATPPKEGSLSIWVEGIMAAREALTPETRKLIEEYKARQ